MTKNSWLSGVLLLAVAGTAACGGDGLGTCASDTSAAGQTIVTNQCVNCHSSTLSGSARNNAPTDLNFDDLTTVKAHADEMYSEITEGSMPPTGALSSTDQEAVRNWLACVSQ